MKMEMKMCFKYELPRECEVALFTGRHSHGSEGGACPLTRWGSGCQRDAAPGASAAPPPPPRPRSVPAPAGQVAEVAVVKGKLRRCDWRLLLRRWRSRVPCGLSSYFADSEAVTSLFLSRSSWHRAERTSRSCTAICGDERCGGLALVWVLQAPWRTAEGQRAWHGPSALPF